LGLSIENNFVRFHRLRHWTSESFPVIIFVFRINEVCMLPMDNLREIEEMLTSGQLAQDFRDGCEDDRHLILDFLEKLMELGEAADKTATELIFKGSYLEMFTGAKAHK
jgi:hypothetical protein